MKHLLVLSFLALFSTSLAKAIPVPNPIPGLQAALQFCLAIEDVREIPYCVRLESSANWVSRDALPICALQSLDEERVRCLAGIVNKEIYPDEVQICDSLTFANEKARCLGKISRPFPYRTRIKVDPRPGLEAATLLCQSFSYDEDKRRCQALVAEAELFTVEAVQFCGELFSDQDRISCLGRLSNRFIVRDEVTLCQKVSMQEEQMFCLEEVQRKYKLHWP